VPLSDGAMTILEKMAEPRSGDTLFPGQAAGKPRRNVTIRFPAGDCRLQATAECRIARQRDGKELK